MRRKSTYMIAHGSSSVVCCQALVGALWRRNTLFTAGGVEALRVSTWGWRLVKRGAVPRSDAFHYLLGVNCTNEEMYRNGLSRLSQLQSWSESFIYERELNLVRRAACALTLHLQHSQSPRGRLGTGMPSCDSPRMIGSGIHCGKTVLTKPVSHISMVRRAAVTASLQLSCSPASFTPRPVRRAHCSCAPFAVSG